jgi:hypothetical protein
MAARSRHIPVDWSVQVITVGGTAIPVARLLVSACFRLIGTGRPSLPEICWLDTGAPISVVPFWVHNQRLIWQPLGLKTTWSGQSCDLGRVDVWFTAAPGVQVAGPFSLLAKFPSSDPPGDPVPVLLGLEFFLSHRGYLSLAPSPGIGSIRLP